MATVKIKTDDASVSATVRQMLALRVADAVSSLNRALFDSAEWLVIATPRRSSAVEAEVAAGKNRHFAIDYPTWHAHLSASRNPTTNQREPAAR